MYFTEHYGFIFKIHVLLLFIVVVTHFQLSVNFSNSFGSIQGFLGGINDKVKVKVAQSCPILCDPMKLYSPWNSPGQSTGVGSLSLLQGVFPTQGSNPGLLHCRQILYQLSHKGSPVIKNPPTNAECLRDAGSIPWVGKIPWRRAWQPTPVFLPGESQ